MALSLVDLSALADLAADDVDGVGGDLGDVDLDASPVAQDTLFGTQLDPGSGSGGGDTSGQGEAVPKMYIEIPSTEPADQGDVPDDRRDDDSAQTSRQNDP